MLIFNFFYSDSDLKISLKNTLTNQFNHNYFFCHQLYSTLDSFVLFLHFNQLPFFLILSLGLSLYSIQKLKYSQKVDMFFKF